MDSQETHNAIEGIAIIGMAGRFPGARNINEFWQNLCDGVESVTFFADDELAAAGVDPALLSNPNYVKARAILEDVDLFDASFFGFTPREADMLDPQHRLFLECAWHALENAGYNAQQYDGKIGVYAGVHQSNYLLKNLWPNQDFINSAGHFQVLLSNDKDFMPTRVSYKLNLKGPGVNINTACSTSLVAVHMAYHSLLSYQCDVALAGGARIHLPQKEGYLYQEGGILSADGHCRAFDAGANGTVQGNGAAVVVLKRLEDALADGDNIYAVVKGSAINNDGALKVGYTAPGVEGQAEVIAEAQAIADIHPETITYIETHGTGTALGDPIEIAALTQAFRAHTPKKGFCAIGSVKTNVGHLDAAAGVAGLIKTALALKHQVIPPSLHFQQPNPKLELANSPFFVNTSLRPWQTGDGPRRAGVSSFGIGGTNAHVVLEEAPAIKSAGPSRLWHPIVISAKTNTALESATTHLIEHLKQHPELNLADVAYTLQVGRQAFEQRRVVVAQNGEDAVSTLEPLDAKRVFTSHLELNEPAVVFMFPGQGAQHVNMGLELYRQESLFREHIDTCAQLLKARWDFDLRQILYPPEETEEAIQFLEQTHIAQLALFAVEYALAKLWMAWGVQPQAMIGHSLGEYVAACLAGVFSLEDALTILSIRGQLMQSLPKGAMLTVPLSEKAVQPLLGSCLSVAAVNASELCVASGPISDIEALEHQLSQQNIQFRRLPTTRAFHSEVMESVQSAFAQQIEHIKLRPPQIPYISNITGTWITVAEAIKPGYWAKHLRQTVRFADGVNELLQNARRVLLEVGPGQTLSTLARQHSRAKGRVILSSLPHSQDSSSQAAVLLNTLGRLWLAGVQIDWNGFYARQRRHRLPLPTYPFERQRYWVDPPKIKEPAPTYVDSSGKDPNIANWFYIPSWKRTIPVTFSEQKYQPIRNSCGLVFVDPCELGIQIMKHMEQQGQTVFAVTPGEQFEQIDSHTFTINPRQRDDYDTLLETLRLAGQIPTHIIHLWSVTLSKSKVGLQNLEQFQNLGFYSLLFLAQAFGKQIFAHSLYFYVVSNNTQEVIGGEILQPEKTTILGPCKVIPQEYSNINCTHIDIALPKTGLDEQLVEQLIAEFSAVSSASTVAYRGNHRWEQTFEPVRLEKAITNSTKLQTGGVYLITGGLGGIGLVLAEYLAQTVQAKIVLTGRSPFPQKDKWSEWLSTHKNQDKISIKIRKLQTLEQLGTEILVVQADVTNLKQMEAAVAQAYQHFGKINGVIHAAGVAGDGAIQLTPPQAAARVMAPKVTGALVLETVLKNKNIDFMVLCSSLASILGQFGQVDYCAANNFLDTFAHYYTQKGTPTLSINWDTWQEVGMAANTPVPIDLKAQRAEGLRQGISSQEGADAFSRILRCQLPQVVVSTQNLSYRMKQKEVSRTIMEPEGAKKTPASVLKYRRPHLAATYVAPRNKMEQIIADIWQELLGINQVGVDDNFFELGGHSLLATQVISRMRDTFQVKLSLQSIFDATTIAEFARVIEEKLIENLEQLSEEEAQSMLQRST